MRRLARLLATVALAACGSPAPTALPRAAAAPPGPHSLRPARAFDDVADRTARSRALFSEASRVFLHPRCTNCHPAGDVPAQGDAGRAHDPPVVRGLSDSGVVGMECGSCHQDANAPLARVPGAPGWRLAPRSMAWVSRTPGAICAQLKDPSQNGGRTLAQVGEHVAHDRLVAWGWAPGHDRVPAPGDQATFATLVAAWIETGAACPEEAAR